MQAYIENVLNNAPCRDLGLHTPFAVTTQFVNGETWMASISAVIFKIALDFEILREATVLRGRIRVHSFLREFVSVFLDEACVQRKPAY
jgi:hypothetical protein